MSWVLNVPISLNLGSKCFYLNMNVYRNTHYHILNKAKQQFKEDISEELNKLSPMGAIEIDYCLHPKTKRLCDISNICCVVDKFFSDALVESGILEDDNYTIIQKITYSVGSIDKDNPRVQITIREIK